MEGPEFTNHPPACPRCGYDQSGVVATWTDRCPLQSLCTECGRCFLWSTIFDPRRTTFRWSFEHARHPFGAIPRLFTTVGRVVQPSVYWRCIGLSEPVRSVRILVLVVVWWLLVRAAFSIPLAVVLKMNFSGNARISGLLSAIPTAWNPATVWLLYREAFVGGIRRVWSIGWQETDDSLEVFFLSLWCVHLSVAWYWFARMYFWRTVREHHLIAHLRRSWLMSLLLFPMVQEFTRLAAGWGFTMRGSLSGWVALWVSIGSIVMVGYWWRCAMRTIVPVASARFFVLGNLFAPVAGALMHGLVTILIERVY